MIRVSFSLFLCLSVFCYFTLLLIFIKIVLLLLLFYLFIFMKMFFFSCSGMFRNVPACSGMFHVPDFIDGRQKQHFARCQFKFCKLQKRAEQFMELFNVFELKILSYYLEFSAPPENFFFLL